MDSIIIIEVTHGSLERFFLRSDSLDLLEVEWVQRVYRISQHGKIGFKLDGYALITEELLSREAVRWAISRRIRLSRVYEVTDRVELNGVVFLQISDDTSSVRPLSIERAVRG